MASISAALEPALLNNPNLPARHPAEPEAARGRSAEDDTAPARFDAAAVRVALSDQAEAAERSGVGRAIEGAADTLAEEAEKLFLALGMSPAEARQAAAALAGAVRDEATATVLPETLRPAETGQPAALPLRGSLVVEEAVIRWDQNAGRYVAGVQRVAIAVDVEDGYVAPRGPREQLADPGKRIAVIRLDAALPLDPGNRSGGG